MEPKYISKKSMLTSFTLLRILFFWLIIPTILIIVDIIRAKVEKVEFYDKVIRSHTGILSKNQTDTTFKGVVSVKVEQSFFGRIFHFGNVIIDLVGKDNLYLEKVKNPFELKKFLETRLVDVDSTQTTIVA